MMTNLDIIFLLVIVFVIYNKLKNILGTRPDNTEKTTISDESAAKIFDIIMKDAEQSTSSTNVENKASEELSELDKSLAKIPNFDKNKFINGSKRAFEIIITAFSKGDVETLEMLVSKALFKKFQNVIGTRKQNSISAETDFIGFESADIVDATINKSDVAKISVKFVSEQVNILKNAEGEVIEGDENFIQKITDIWTFEKSITSTNPNWILVSTKK